MNVKVTLVRSLIGKNKKHIATVKALGLRKINSTVSLKLNPMLSGMLKTVNYLVLVEELK